MRGHSYIARLWKRVTASHNERGTTIVEYAGMLAGIGVVVIASLVFLGGAVGGNFADVVINAPLTDADYAINPHECKKGGWQTMTDAGGNSFTNQGDCISYANEL